MIVKAANDTRVWLLEMNNVPLKVDKTGNTYKFRGLCAEFGVMNENERYYDEVDYDGKVKSLTEKISKRALLGELDHNEEFLVELKNASHVITGLHKVSNGYEISIELLDTDQGRNAKALVDAKVPLFISSRASGYIDNHGNVSLEKIYTYDLVSEPGFKDAELKPLNESISRHKTKKSNLRIYAMKDEEADEEELKINKTKLNVMDGYVSKKEFERFTKHLNNKLGKINESIGKLAKSGSPMMISESLVTPKDLKVNGISMEMLNSIPAEDDMLTADGEDYTINEVVNIDDTLEGDEDYKLRGTYKYKVSMTNDDGEEIPGYITSTGEFHLTPTSMNAVPTEMGQMYESMKVMYKKINELVDNGNMQQRDYQSLVTYVDAFAKMFEKQVNKFDKVIKFVNKMADKSDETVKFVNKMADKMDESVEFVNALADHQDVSAKFINGVNVSLNETNKYVNKMADYQDEVAKVTNHLISQSDRATRHLNLMHEHSDQVTERVNRNSALLGTQKRGKMVTEGRISKGSLTSKVSEILKSVKTNKADKNYVILGAKFPFVKSLNDDEVKRFMDLPESSRVSIKESINKGAKPSAALKKAEGDSVGLELLKHIPKNLKGAWNELPLSRKNNIVALFRSKNIRSEAEIENFWYSVDLKQNRIGLQKLNEANGGETGTVHSLGYSADDMDAALGF